MVAHVHLVSFCAAVCWCHTRRRLASAEQSAQQLAERERALAEQQRRAHSLEKQIQQLKAAAAAQAYTQATARAPPQRAPSTEDLLPSPPPLVSRPRRQLPLTATLQDTITVSQRDRAK